MKTVIYKCDYCQRETKRKHLSIHFKGWSGYVDELNGEWKHIENAVRRDCIKQFCNMKCLRGYFLREL